MDIIKNFFRSKCVLRSVALTSENKVGMNMAINSPQEIASDNHKQLEIISLTTNELKGTEATQEPQVDISKSIQESTPDNVIQNKTTEVEDTMDCLKEFDEILEEISTNVKVLPSLDEINDCITHLTEEEHLNGTHHSFQPEYVDIEVLLPKFQINDPNKTHKIGNKPKIQEISDEQRIKKKANEQECNESYNSGDYKIREIDEDILEEHKKHEMDEVELIVIEESDESQEIIMIDSSQNNLETDIISISSEDSQHIAENETKSELNVIDSVENKVEKLQTRKEDDIQDLNLKICEDTGIDDNSDENNKNGEVKDMDDDKENKHISEDDCGYHSSDFEFISEEEAKMDGLIINYKPKNAKITVKDETQVKTIEVTIDGIVSNDRNNNGASKHPEQNLQPSASNLRWYKRRQSPFVLDYSYRLNHRIVNRDEYHTLFNGNANPIPTRSTSSLENKSVRSRSKTLVAYEGIGFDMQMLKRWSDSENDETKEEAQANANKILEKYPTENRKRRRL